MYGKETQYIFELNILIAIIAMNAMYPYNTLREIDHRSKY